MSSLPLEKFQCLKEVSKSFAKFTRAVRKTPRRIADLLGSSFSASHNRSITDSTYASINSLCCRCSCHRCERQELGLSVPNPGGEGKGDAIVRPESYGVVSDHDIKSQSERGSVGDKTSEIEQRMDEWNGMECSSPFEVNERAERFIESFRKSFKDDQKLQIQRSVHDH